MSVLQENLQEPRSSTQEERDHQPRSPEDFINRVEEAFRTGAFALARDLSVEGAERYPDHSDLQQYARVLAPPRVVKCNVPPNPSVRANRDWLKEHRQEYQGRWIALRSGELADTANSLDELVGQVGETQGVLLTKILQCP